VFADLKKEINCVYLFYNLDSQKLKRSTLHMTFSILAILFLATILAVSFVGFRAIIRQGKAPEDVNKEKCSICRTQYNKSQLLEREVGDYRVLHFCQSCIISLHNEIISKN
jgi:hypothetical protein